ncbi:hypothetical protein NMY22_g1306 [Coprinellus aureogranulatus]|nr:hypothetical protein NMY22_g1306 [Coprinellus aureogranulatus]
MTTTAPSRWTNLADDEITADVVYDILGAVSDDVWATAACVDRILPDTNAQHALLVHGISRTDPVLERCKAFLHPESDEETESRSSNEDLLTQHFQQLPSDAQLCQLRSVLLERLGRLNTYVELGKAAAAVYDVESDIVEDEEDELNEWEDDPWAEESTAASPKRRSPATQLPFTFPEFLANGLLSSAKELASQQYFDALHILVKRHSSILWPYRLDILACIPEHAPPSSYRLLLPSLDPSTGFERSWAHEDTSTAGYDFSRLTPTQRAIQHSGRYFGVASLGEECSADGREGPMSSAELTQWYISRVMEIIQTTGLVDVALTLIQHGASQSVSGLDELGEELSLLSRLIYDTPQDSTSPSDWNLDLWRAMSPQAVVQAYLAHSSPSSICNDIMRLVIPYLFVLEARAERAGKPDPGLQERMLSDYVLSAPLELAASIFEASKPTLPVGQRLLRNDVDLAKLALACLYGSDSLDEWPTMSRIFECMPAWATPQDDTEEEAADTTLASLGEFVTPTTSRPRCTPKDLLLFFQPLHFQSLSRALDILDIHLESGEILSRWSVPAPLRWFLQSAGDVNEQKAWANRMARRAGGSIDPLNTVEDWEWLLDDMLKLTERSESGIKGAFGLLSREEIVTIFLSGLLSTGKFDVAKTLLRHPHGKIGLSPRAIEDVCLNCSHELYDNASSGNYKVGDMKLAYDCLDVPSPSPRIVQEKEFIEATSRICSFHVTSNSGTPISPIEIRLTKDRLSLISRVLSCNADAYKHAEVMLDLSSKLGFRNDFTAEVKVLAMMADTALQAEDFERAFEHSQKMIDIVHRLKAQTDGWMLATPTQVQEAIEVSWIASFQLGRQPEFQDLGKKMKLLGQTLELCPADRMHDVLAAWRKLQKEDIEAREERLANPDGAIPQSAARPRGMLDRSGAGAVSGMFSGKNVASSLRARLQDLHMPSPPLLSTPDAAALASRTFKTVASNFPFSIGHRTGSDTSHHTAHASEVSRDHRVDDVGEKASRALSKGIGWLIGVDE